MNILEFKDEHAYLSNFYPCKVKYNGVTYDNAEAAYQAAKCLKPEEKEKFIGIEAKKAKYLGRRITLKPDWEQIKINIMKEVVTSKFTQNPELMKKLLNTTGVIEEGNYWNDTFWGVCKGKGLNHLGKILMELRENTNCKTC